MLPPMFYQREDRKQNEKIKEKHQAWFVLTVWSFSFQLEKVSICSRRWGSAHNSGSAAIRQDQRRSGEELSSEICPRHQLWTQAAGGSREASSLGLTVRQKEAICFASIKSYPCSMCCWWWTLRSVAVAQVSPWGNSQKQATATLNSHFLFHICAFCSCVSFSSLNTYCKNYYIIPRSNFAET